MPAWPDIVVTRADSPEVLLAIEVTARGGGMPDCAAELKAYMLHQSCPVGVLVTPDETRFYRNRFSGYDSSAIDQIGECQTIELLDAIPPRALVTEAILVRLVERWLEGLRLGTSRLWPASAAEAIESYVVPAVAIGLIRATGPRWLRTGS
jgi:hypothetical protein